MADFDNLDSIEDEDALEFLVRNIIIQVTYKKFYYILASQNIFIQ